MHSAIACLLALVTLTSAAHAFEPPIAIKEQDGALPPGLGAPCALAASTDGTCANYRWYNLCAGYLWIYSFGAPSEAVGTRFGGPEQPCVDPCRRAKRMITYWRNIAPNYDQTVDIYLDDDPGLDGCPDITLASDLNLDPGLRWNCSEAGVCFASRGAIVRLVHDGGSAPGGLSTDGPRTQDCDPLGTPRSYYYGIGTTACLPWVGPTGRADNFLTWLIVDSGPACADCPPTATERTSWGGVKGLYR
jgi:hypothetical protein